MLRADSRLTVRGARPNILALIRREWPWARPGPVSRSSPSCVDRIFLTWHHLSP